MTIDLEGLKLYNERFENIKESGFFKYISSHETMGASGNSNNNIIRNYPNEDKIKAFILDFRFFIQNNEKSSLCNLNEIYKNIPTKVENKKMFFLIREKINEQLDEYSGQVVNGKKLTWRDLMNAFIYGYYSHTTKKKEYNEIAPDIVNKEISKIRFIGLICDLIVLLDLISQLNKEVIDELEEGKEVELMKNTIDIELHSNYINIGIVKLDKTISDDEAKYNAIENIENHIEEKNLVIINGTVNVEVIKVDKTISNTEALNYAIKVIRMQINNKK